MSRIESASEGVCPECVSEKIQVFSGKIKYHVITCHSHQLAHLKEVSIVRFFKFLAMGIITKNLPLVIFSFKVIHV